MALSIMTFYTMSISIKSVKSVLLSVTILLFLMSFVLLAVVRLGVIRLSVIMTGVMAPFREKNKMDVVT